MAQFAYAAHTPSVLHWDFTFAVHEPVGAMAEAMHCAQASPGELTLPVAQYSFAHVEVQGPPWELQTQLSMIDARSWAPDG
ncbi:MAG: hypothetical protein ACRELB_26090 [Polyangiaceae bacterium]